MIRKCEGCGKKYHVDTDKVTDPTARFKCKSCGRIIRVYEEPAEEPVLSPLPEEDPFSDEYPESGASPGTDADDRQSLKIQGISIKSKITLVIVLLVFFSIGATGLIASYSSRQSLSEQAEAYLLQYSTQKSREYGSIFANVENQVEALADYAEMMYSRGVTGQNPGYEVLMPWVAETKSYGSPELNETLEEEMHVLQGVSDILRSVVPGNPYLKLGYLGTETGMTVFDNNEVVEAIEQLEGFDVTARPWYEDARNQGETIWTEPYVDANTQELVITCATPVYSENGGFVGSVGVDVLLNTIRDNILALDIGYNSYAFLLNNDGRVLVRPETEKGDARWDKTYASENLLEVDNPEFGSVVRKMIRGHTGISSYPTEEEEKYAAYTPLPVIGASLGIVASRDEVIRPAVNLQNLIIMVCAAILVVSVITGMIIGTAITRPINELTLRANLISQGKTDLDVLPENRKDELGLLTKSFNRLVRSLKMAMSSR